MVIRTEAVVIRYFALYVSILSLCSCSTFQKSESISADQLLVQESYTFQSKDQLAKSEVRSDLAVLIYALKNGYGGRKYVPQDVFKKALNALEKIDLDKVSSQTFCEEIEKSLTQIPDMHLSARIQNQFCSPLRKTKFKKGNVGPNFAKNKDRAWELNYIPVAKNQIPILSITTFPNNEDKEWFGFLDSVLRIKRTAPAIIIDLRGNSGGDDTMGLNMADYLFGQDAPTSIQEIIKSQTPATFAIGANSPKVRILRLKMKSEPIPPYLEQRLQKDMEKFASALRGELPEEKSVPGRSGKEFDRTKAYTKPIVVLTDHGCASSCESTLETLLLHPQVVSIGENTAGYMHFGNVGLVVLPKSQIMVQMATDFWKYKDGRFLEGVGYNPKIQVQPGIDALKIAKDYLQKELKKLR